VLRPAPGRDGVKERGWIAVYSYPGRPAPGRHGELHFNERQEIEKRGGRK